MVVVAGAAAGGAYYVRRKKQSEEGDGEQENGQAEGEQAKKGKFSFGRFGKKAADDGKEGAKTDSKKGWGMPKIPKSAGEMKMMMMMMLL